MYYKVGCIILIFIFIGRGYNVINVQAAKLNYNNITVYEGKHKSLRLHTSSNKKITWKSKNKKIATVDKNGKVKGIKQGKTTITAYQNGKRYNCKIAVLFDSAKATQNLKVEICRDIKSNPYNYNPYNLVKITNRNKFDVIINKGGFRCTTTYPNVYDEDDVLVSEGGVYELKNYKSSIIIKANSVCYVPYCIIDSTAKTKIQIINSYVERCKEEYIDIVDSNITVSYLPYNSSSWRYSLELQSEWGRDINVVGILIYEDDAGNKCWTDVHFQGRDGMVYKYYDEKLYDIKKMKFYWYNYGC